LNAAQQELAEYAVLMQAREQEVRQLTEKIQEITGIRLLAEVPATPVENEGGKGGPFLEESLLPVEEQQLGAEPLDSRVILEQELSSYHSTHHSLERLYEEIIGNEILWRSTPTIAPVEDPSVSSHYGRRPDPFTNLPAFHSGIDFSGPAGTPIYAPADGIVRKAGPAAGYGLLVELDHGSGISIKNFKPTDYMTRYGHLSRLAVQANQFIQRGELLGHTGNTGRSTSSHLHYEIHVNKRPINPWRNLSHFSISR
jgi:murein DD-endopeptidase MepM/ murein hydrolase activator NlpD